MGGGKVEELELPERAGGAVAPRRDAPEGSELGRQPAGGGRRSWAVEERRLLRAQGDALDAADADAFAIAPDLEGAIGAERKHTERAGEERKKGIYAIS